MLEHLRALAVFSRTAELGSFRAAARALGLAPSVVSHHVTSLERVVGLPLLYRSTRRLALTPDGERLFVSAREMVAAAERGFDVVSGRSESPSGALRMTAPAFLAETSFAGDLAAFSGAHPNVTLSVSFTDARRDLLGDGLDLALRVGALEDSAHKSRKLAEMRRALVASPAYLRGRETPATLRDLELWDFVQLSQRPAEVVMRPPGKKSPQSLAVRSRLRVDGAAAMRGLAIAGAGLASVPEVLVRDDLARGRLVVVLPDWQLAPMTIHALWPDSAQRPKLTLRFLDFVAPRLTHLFQ